MATIRFDYEKMQQIQTKMQEAKDQLQQVLSVSQEKLEQIAKNIQSEIMTKTLLDYAQNSVERSQGMINRITKMDEFLSEQISAYKQADVTASETVTDVQKMLSQISS